MIEVTFVYKDSSQWFAGAFNDIKSANAYVSKEQLKPYWDKATTVNYVDKTPDPVIEAARKAALAAQQAADKVAMDRITVLKGKATDGSWTQADKDELLKMLAGQAVK